jgi:hypothetical protein
MAKMTLLNMVQDILSDMNSDEVNSINDSTEALQVAQIIKTSYYNIIDGKDYPWLKELFQLDGNGTALKPTHMAMPETIIDLEWIKYDCKKDGETRNRYTTIDYKTPEEFLDIVYRRLSTDSNILVVTDATGVKLNIHNDRPPQCFTSFDDNTLVFDAYDSDVESTLMNSKTQCFGKRSVAFTLSDSFTPDLPVQMFSYLLNEAKSTSFLILKQMPNPKAEQIATSQKRKMSQEAWKIQNGITYPNYGRKPNSSGRY